MSATLTKKTAYLTLSWPAHAFGYVLVPVVVSRLTARHGWSGNRPGPCNDAGLVLVVVGAGVIGWAITSHYRASPDRIEHLLPRYLVTTGAYGRTRNPLYLGGLTMWAGWTLFFGSVSVAVGAVVLAVGFDRLGVPYEERRLAAAFGAQYATYRQRVPRWFGPRADRA